MLKLKSIHMKKIIFSSMCIILVVQSFCQVNPVSLTKEEYLKKRKTQNTTGWVLLAGGTTLLIIGGTMGANFNGLFDPNRPPQSLPKNESLATILQITGGAATLASIPFFVAASKNKKKAMSVALSIERMPAINYGSGMAYPAVGLQLQLGKSN